MDVIKFDTGCQVFFFISKIVHFHLNLWYPRDVTMRCKTCSHPDAKTINEMIANNVSFSRIASQFNLVDRSISRHAERHLQPMIEQAQAEIRAAVVQRALSLREDVALPVLEKIKLLQERILNDIEALGKAERGPFYRELRGALQEEAKLCGLYQENRENDAKVRKAIIDLKRYLDEQDEIDRETVIEVFATGRNIPRETLSRELGPIG